MKRSLCVLLLLLYLLGFPSGPVMAQSGFQILSDEALLEFPERVTFQAEFSSSAKITAITLEYGVDQLTCGSVVAKAFPLFTPGNTLVVQWTWEMLQSGSIPPGGKLWWQWRVTDESGARFTSPKQTILWLDDIHNWVTISGGNINLHTYNAPDSFARELHDAAVTAMDRLSQEVGLRPARPVDIYIYANTDDLRQAVLYEPAWIGGQAYAENNVVIIAISMDQIEWGKDTLAHELTHVLVGQKTFTCLGFMPNWLVEGLAMVGEGGLDDYQQNLLDQAIREDSVPSLQSLTGGFPEEATRASLSYAASYSVTDYLVSTHGAEKMSRLLERLSEGYTADEALLAVYGFGLDELERDWRLAIGVSEQGTGELATPRPTPTIVATIAPYSGFSDAGYATPTATQAQGAGTPAVSDPMPTAQAGTGQTATRQPPDTGQEEPSLIERLGIDPEIITIVKYGLLCIVLAVIVIAGPILLTTRRKHRRKS